MFAPQPAEPIRLTVNWLSQAKIKISLLKKDQDTDGPVAGAVAVCLLRFLCHFLSGMIIWDVYAPEGQPIWLYSLTYNGSYMLVETVLTAAAVALLYAPLMRLSEKSVAGK